MSVSTKVYLIKQHGIDNFISHVKKAIRIKFESKVIGDIDSRNCQKKYDENKELFYHIDFALDYYTDGFTDKKEHRSISIFWDSGDMRQDYYLLYFNAWGHNKEIAKCLVDYFGGFANYSDCDNVEIDYCKSQYNSFLGVKTN